MQGDVAALEPLLIAGVAPGNRQTVPPSIELPGVKHARDALWRARGTGLLQISRRFPQQQRAAVRADVEESPHHAILTANDRHGFAGDAGRAKIERRGELALVRDEQPALSPDLRALFRENARIGVDATIDERQRGAAEPLAPLSRALGTHFSISPSCSRPGVRNSR